MSERSLLESLKQWAADADPGDYYGESVYTWGWHEGKLDLIEDLKKFLDDRERWLNGIDRAKKGEGSWQAGGNEEAHR